MPVGGPHAHREEATVLTLEIRADAGATITGSRADLRGLAAALLEAAVVGEAQLVFVPDQGVTTVDVRCVS